MNKKIIYVLLVILGVLLIFSYMLKKTGGPTSEPKSFSALKLEFDPESIAAIDVYKQDYPDSGLHFAKIDTEWVVTNDYNVPAKKTDIEKLLTDLNGISGQIRGESADLYPDFEITDEMALQIEGYDSEGSKLIHLYIGKGGSGRESFVRIAGSPVVYLAGENFISRFAAWNAPPEKKLPTDRWIELSLCDIPRQDLKSFKINKGNKVYEFALIKEVQIDSMTPPAEVWTQVSPKKGLQLEESKIKRLQSVIPGLRGSGVAAPENRDKFGLDNPDYSLWAADSTGKSAYIKFSKPVNDEEDRYAVVEGKSSVYKIPKSAFNRVFEDPFTKPDK